MIAVTIRRPGTLFHLLLFMMSKFLQESNLICYVVSLVINGLSSILWVTPE